MLHFGTSGTLKQQHLKFPNYLPHILLFKSNGTINGHCKELTDTELKLVNKKVYERNAQQSKIRLIF